jgi:hypothetical protein
MLVVVAALAAIVAAQPPPQRLPPEFTPLPNNIIVANGSASHVTMRYALLDDSAALFLNITAYVAGGNIGHVEIDMPQIGVIQLVAGPAPAPPARPQHCFKIKSQVAGTTWSVYGPHIVMNGGMNATRMDALLQLYPVTLSSSLAAATLTVYHGGAPSGTIVVANGPMAACTSAPNATGVAVQGSVPWRVPGSDIDDGSNGCENGSPTLDFPFPCSVCFGDYMLPKCDVAIATRAPIPQTGVTSAAGYTTVMVVSATLSRDMDSFVQATFTSTLARVLGNLNAARLVIKSVAAGSVVVQWYVTNEAGSLSSAAYATNFNDKILTTTNDFTREFRVISVTYAEEQVATATTAAPTVAAVVNDGGEDSEQGLARTTTIVLVVLVVVVVVGLIVGGVLLYRRSQSQAQANDPDDDGIGAANNNMYGGAPQQRQDPATGDPLPMPMVFGASGNDGGEELTDLNHEV